MAKKRRNKKNSGIINKFFMYVMHFGFAGFAAIALIMLYFSRDLPDLSNLKTAIRNPSVVIQTYDGNIIGSYGDLYEDVVGVEELPKHVPAAFMAVEDRRFMNHFGIDFIGFFRAVYNNYVSGRVVQGGSTITQQLAKNILIGEGIVTHYDRSIGRKVRELLLALWLEHKFSKRDIMMMYLNRVYFGAGTYGIDAAARKYFNKSARNLSIFESAILAGVLKAPSKYSPTNNPGFSSERAKVVLKTMEEQGFIKSADEIEKAEANAAFSNDSKKQKGHMYFCDFVYDQAKKILGEIEDDIIIVSTLDQKKQAASEEAIDFYIKTESDNYKFSQASFVCYDRDGAVLAMVGGRGYSATQFNRVTQATRLPGSAFKIFVYGAALEYGFQLNDMIADTPISIAGWRPANYKWASRGKISLLDGFTHSVNSVSIRLAQSIGLKRVANFAKKLGIAEVSQNDMSIALGTTPTTLKDLTAAYTSFFDGNAVWPYCISEIRTRTGDVLYQYSPNNVKIMDDELLKSCRALLSSVVQRGTGRACKHEHVFGKTGTNGHYDAWFVGFYDPPNVENAGFSFGAWVGNDNNSSKMTPNSTGGRIPARIVSRFIKNVEDGQKGGEVDEKGREDARSSLDSLISSIDG